MGKPVRIVKTLSAVFLLNIVDYLLAPITTILIAKNLSVGDYGFYSWTGTLIGFITTFFTLGLAQYNFRAIPGRPLETQYRIFGRSLFLELAGSTAGAFVIIFLMRDDLITYGVIFLFFVRMLFTVVNNEMIRFFGLQKKNILKSVLALIDARIMFLPLLGFFFLKMITVSTVYFSLIAGNVLSFVLFLFLINRKSFFGNIRPDADFAKTALKISLPLVLVDLSMYLQEMGSRYILKMYCTYEELGLFSFAYSWFALIFKFGMLVIYTLQPYFSESYQHHVEQKEGAIDIFNNQLKIGLRYSLILLGGVSIVFLCNYADIIVLVGKEQYADTVLAAWLFGLFPVFMFMTYFNQIIMMLMGKTKIMPLIYLVSGILNLSLNVLLVPRFGYEAAAFVTTFSYLILAVLFSFQTRSPEFAFCLSIREYLEMALFFVLLLGLNMLLITFIETFFVRLAILVPTGCILLLLVVKKNDLTIIRMF